MKTEDVEKNLVKLTFEVSAEDFTKAINEAYKKNAKKFNIPGFRKGSGFRELLLKSITQRLFFMMTLLMRCFRGLMRALLKRQSWRSLQDREIDVEDIKKGEPVVLSQQLRYNKAGG